MNTGIKSVNISLVMAIVLGITTLAGLGAFMWAYTEMDYYQNEADLIVAEAVSEAREEQRQADEEIFVEEAKNPHSVFTSPSDYGSVSFEYPKTWASYNDKNDNSGYVVYFYPTMVPPIQADRAFALRLNVTSQSYDTVVRSFNTQVNRGELSATPISTAIDGFQGLRLNGQISKSLNGSIVVFRVRDKTLTLQVDSSDFMADFNNIILPTLTFSP